MKFPSGDLQQIFSEILKKKTKFSENSEIIFTGIIKKKSQWVFKKNSKRTIQEILKKFKETQRNTVGDNSKNYHRESSRNFLREGYFWRESLMNFFWDYSRPSVRDSSENILRKFLPRILQKIPYSNPQKISTGMLQKHSSGNPHRNYSKNFRRHFFKKSHWISHWDN